MYSSLLVFEDYLPYFAIHLSFIPEFRAAVALGTKVKAKDTFIVKLIEKYSINDFLVVAKETDCFSKKTFCLVVGYYKSADDDILWILQLNCLLVNV